MNIQVKRTPATYDLKGLTEKEFQALYLGTMLLGQQGQVVVGENNKISSHISVARQNELVTEGVAGQLQTAILDTHLLEGIK